MTSRKKLGVQMCVRIGVIRADFGGAGPGRSARVGRPWPETASDLRFCDSGAEAAVDSGRFWSFGGWVREPQPHGFIKIWPSEACQTSVRYIGAKGGFERLKIALSAWSDSGRSGSGARKICYRPQKCRSEAVFEEKITKITGKYRGL